MPLTYGPRLEGLRVEPLRTYVGLKLNNHDWRNPLQGATPMHICPNEVKVKWRSHHSEIREKGMTGNKTATIHVRVCLGATSFGPLQPGILIARVRRFTVAGFWQSEAIFLFLLFLSDQDVVRGG